MGPERLRLVSRPVIIGCLVGLSLIAPPASPDAKSYHHPAIEQSVTVRSDGTLDVIDERVYSFDGEFHNAFLTVDPRSGGDVVFGGVTSADGRPVRNVRVEGSTLRWQYDADDEERRFRIAYSLTGELEKAQDCVLLDRQLVEPEHAAVDVYRLSLQLPQPATLFKVFVITPRGIIGEMIVNEEKGLATIEMENVRADEWVRVRALFDPAQVPSLVGIDEPRYETWLTETARATEAYRRRSRALLAGRGRRTAPFPTAVAPLMAAAAAVFSWFAVRAYRSRGVEPIVKDIGPYYREPPEEIPPAAVPFVIEQFSPGTTAASQALGATLLDFARRGYLTLAEREKAGFLGLGGGSEVDFKLAREPDPNDVTPFEKDVWQMLQKASGDDGTVTPKELKSFFTKRTTWMESWCSRPRDWYETTRGPLLAGGHGWWMFLLIGAGIVLMAGLIVVSIMSNNPVVLITGIASGVAAGLFGLICGVALPRWRPEALLRARQWKAYARFLADFSAMEQAPAEHYKMWDYHFIYATALGVSKKYLANLRKLMVSNPGDFSTPAWIMAGGSRSGALSVADAASGLSVAQAHLESIQTNLAALESALSASTSAGGGFSGGGAGGSSGGGGSSGAS